MHRFRGVLVLVLVLVLGRPSTAHSDQLLSKRLHKIKC